MLHNSFQKITITISINAWCVNCSRVSCRLLCSAVSSDLSHSSAEEEGGEGGGREGGEAGEGRCTVCI